MLKNNHILKYLVTGTGRCGTVYMSRLLTSLNIMCGHESVFNQGGLSYAKSVLIGIQPCKLSFVSKNDIRTKSQDDSWFNPNIIVADSSLYSVPFLNDKILKKTKILHLVRNPLKVISSFFLDSNIFDNLNFGKCPYRKFIFSNLPELFNIESCIKRCLYYFNTWNKKILEKSLTIHQVENGLDEQLCDFLNIIKPKIIFDDRKINTWKNGNNILKISDLPDGKLKDEFMDITKIFGYDISYKNDTVL